MPPHERRQPCDIDVFLLLRRHGVVARNQHRKPLDQQSDDDQEYAGEDVYENFVHNFRLLCFGRMQLCDHPGGESVAGAGSSDNFA